MYEVWDWWFLKNDFSILFSCFFVKPAVSIYLSICLSVCLSMCVFIHVENMPIIDKLFKICFLVYLMNAPFLFIYVFCQESCITQPCPLLADLSIRRMLTVAAELGIKRRERLWMWRGFGLCCGWGDCGPLIKMNFCWSKYYIKTM